MKMIIAIVQNKDSNHLRIALAKAHFGATQLSTTGSFLQSKNSTFMIVVKDDQVDAVLDVIKKHAKTREQFMTPSAYIDNAANSMPVNVQVGGATVFVLPVDSMFHF